MCFPRTPLESAQRTSSLTAAQRLSSITSSITAAQRITVFSSRLETDCRKLCLLSRLYVNVNVMNYLEVIINYHVTYQKHVLYSDKSSCMIQCLLISIIYVKYNIAELLQCVKKDTANSHRQLLLNISYVGITKVCNGLKFQLCIKVIEFE